VPRVQLFESLTSVGIILLLVYGVSLVLRGVWRNPDVPEAKEVVAELRKRRAAREKSAPELSPEMPAEKVYYLKADKSRANPMDETEAKHARKQGYEVIEG
jgi:hypothetical protein